MGVSSALRPPGRPPYPVVCAIHIHSIYSDGTSDMSEIVGKARAAGIEVVMITDHHTMAAGRHGWAGWHDGVLVIVGYEHSDPNDTNHLLVFGLEQPLDPTLIPAQYVSQAANAGAAVFLAHPVERRARRGRIRPYPWTAGMALPFHGIEVWNFMSLWVERYTPRRGLLHYVLPGLAGERPDHETLALWDRCAQSRPVAGIAGLDAHALKVCCGPLRMTLFPLARMLQGPLTVVELATPLSRSDARADTAMVLAHLAQGHSIMGLPRLGPLQEIEATAGDALGSVWGEVVPMGDTLDLSLRLPRPAGASLLREGRVMAHARGRDLSFSIAEPGAYRVELRRFGLVWALTNHFRARRE